VRAGYLEFDRAFVKSLAKFAAAGLVLSASLWITARFAAVYFAQLHAFRDETALLLLIVTAAFVYGFSILLLFGRGWLFSLLRDRQPSKSQ
jgi:putative peptidoglycan lipid II flippase